ncbi:9806_t:CDS:2, partial [Gigaspora rosea]
SIRSTTGVFDKQSSSSSLITQTFSSPIQNSTFSIESNILQSLVQNQNHLINIPEPHSLSIQTPMPSICQYQGKKTIVVEKQSNTCSKHSEHKNYPLDPLTNKFGIMQQKLTKLMLVDIEFWTIKSNFNMLKREQQFDNEAVTLINQLLEYKAENTQWIIN